MSEAKNPHKQLADRRQYLENLGAELKDAMRQKLLFEKYRLQLAAEGLKENHRFGNWKAGFLILQMKMTGILRVYQE